MKRALLALVLMAAAVGTTLTPDTAEARRGYGGGYRGGYGYRPSYSYRSNYGYRPSYGYGYSSPYYYNSYRPNYYNSYRPYYYNTYRPSYYQGSYYQPGVRVYGNGFGVYVR